MGNHIAIDRVTRGAIQGELLGRLDDIGRALVPEVRRRSSDDTGALDASYKHELEPASLRVLIGTELLHGRFRELGTIHTRPEAAIRRAVAENRGRIERGLSG